MNPKQRVLLTQMQISGLGLVVSAFGFFTDAKELIYVGFAILAFGLIRLLLMRRLLEGSGEDLSDGESLDSIIEEAKRKEARIKDRSSNEDADDDDDESGSGLF